MLTYLIVVAVIALLGLLINEDRWRSSIVLAFLYGSVMVLVGWWQDWPTQVASSCTLVRPVVAFMASRMAARFIPKKDERYCDIPITVYFGLNIITLSEFLLN